MTLTLYFLCLVLAPVAFADPAARLIAADMRTAIDRACHSLQSVAIDLEVPLNKLSDQLNGKASFTYLWRILATFPDVRMEFYDIQTDRANAVLVRAGELSALVGGVRDLIAAVPKRMAKASLLERGRKVQAG